MAKIYPGTAVTILEGPKCNGGMVWWHVELANGTIRGWTSEGDAAAYWLVPEEPGPTEPPTDY